MTPLDRAWWIRLGCFVVLSQLLGYFLAIALRDRYSQDLCAMVVLGVLMMLDELRSYLKRRRTISPARPPGGESSARPFQDT